MGKLPQSLLDKLTKDDLFLRVILFVFSLFALWLGTEAVQWLMNPTEEHWGWSLAAGLTGALFLSWGVVVIVGAFAPPSSRWSKLAERCYPDPSGLDDLALFLVVVLAPAAALTLLLRAFGIRGYDT